VAALSQSESIKIGSAELKLGMPKGEVLRRLAHLRTTKIGDPEFNSDMISVGEKGTSASQQDHTLQFDEGKLVMVNRHLGSTEDPEAIQMLSQLFYTLRQNTAITSEGSAARTTSRTFLLITMDEVGGVNVPGGEMKLRSIIISEPSNTGQERELRIDLNEPIGRSGSSATIAEVLGFEPKPSTKDKK
jgi:hypothetical protein